MEKILKISNWYIFLILALLVFLPRLIGLNESVSENSFVLLFFLWNYFFNKAAYKKLDKSLKSKISSKIFIFLFILTIVVLNLSYIIFFGYLPIFLLSFILSNQEYWSLINHIPFSFREVMITSFMFSKIQFLFYTYTAYFSSKTLISLEIDRLPKFNELIKTFFQFLLFPFGVLFLHKRIKNIFFGLNRKANSTKELLFISALTIVFSISILLISLPNHYFDNADQYMEKNKFELAIISYKKGLLFNPNDIKANFNLGKIYHDQKNIESAIKYYSKVLELDKFDKEANNNLSIIYSEQGKDKELIALYGKVLEKYPNDIEVNFNLGEIYAKQKNLKSAIKYYLKVLELDKFDREANNNLANIYNEQGKSKEAISLYNKALEKYPDDKATSINLGEAHAKQKNFDTAIKYYNRALLNTSKEYNDIVHYDLACAYSLKNNKIEALNYLQKAIAIDKKLSEEAKNDNDFKNIKNEKKFIELTNN